MKGAAQCAARVFAAPIVERSEQEPPEAQRRPATRTQVTVTCIVKSGGYGAVTVRAVSM